MSEHSASQSEDESGPPSSPNSSEEEEEWIRFPDCNWEYTRNNKLRAIRLEGPFHLPVTVYLVRIDLQGRWELSKTEVHPANTIFDVEWGLRLHRSGVSAAKLACPVSREDLISRGLDPEEAGKTERCFRESLDLRVEDLHGYFFENQVFRILWL